MVQNPAGYMVPAAMLNEPAYVQQPAVTGFVQLGVMPNQPMIMPRQVYPFHQSGGIVGQGEN